MSSFSAVRMCESSFLDLRGLRMIICIVVRGEAEDMGMQC